MDSATHERLCSRRGRTAVRRDSRSQILAQGSSLIRTESLSARACHSLGGPSLTSTGRRARPGANLGFPSTRRRRDPRRSLPLRAFHAINASRAKKSPYHEDTGIPELLLPRCANGVESDWCRVRWFPDRKCAMQDTGHRVARRAVRAATWQINAAADPHAARRAVPAHCWRYRRADRHAASAA